MPLLERIGFLSIFVQTIEKGMTNAGNRDDAVYYSIFQSGLERELLKICTDAGLLEGVLLRTDDIDDKWKEFAPEYMADGVPDIADYPTVSVGWAAYAGMAVACWWNRDWEKLGGQPYSALKGPGGWDDMDENIMQNILGILPASKETEQINAVMQSCAQTAVALIRREQAEPQSPRAFYLYARTVQVMFSLGAAVELYRLGYEMRKIQ